MCFIPDELLDPWQRRWRAYDNRNGLRPNPLEEVERDRGIHLWCEAEKHVFMEKFLQVCLFLS